MDRHTHSGEIITSFNFAGRSKNCVHLLCIFLQCVYIQMRRNGTQENTWEEFNQDFGDWTVTQ